MFGCLLFKERDNMALFYNEALRSSTPVIQRESHLTIQTSPSDWFASKLFDL